MGCRSRVRPGWRWNEKEDRVKPSRPGALVLLLVAVAVVTWAVLQKIYSDLPTVPWTAIPTVLLLAIGEAYSGWMTRARIERRPDTKPVEPLAVARLAALAKASAYVGAAFAGVFAGFVFRVAGMLDQDTPQRDFFLSGGSLIACVVLVCAALFLEHCCRVPKRPEDDSDT
jgi:DMSO reductase anchor subunit